MGMRPSKPTKHGSAGDSQESAKARGVALRAEARAKGESGRDHVTPM
jgi:hypothetical protein